MRRRLRGDDDHDNPRTPHRPGLVHVRGERIAPTARVHRAPGVQEAAMPSLPAPSGMAAVPIWVRVPSWLTVNSSIMPLTPVWT
ncbi:hypothetical protein ABH931_004622 [Streptacidiphilus sp. MAP12-33]